MNMRKLIIAAASTIAVASVAAIGYPRFHPQSFNVGVGQSIFCQINCNGTLLVTGNDGGVDASGAGSAQFVCKENVDQAQADAEGVPVSAKFAPLGLTISGDNPQYGTFSFSYDPTRDAPLTTIVANQQGEQFPATADVYANVQGTISGLPGTFRNSTTCHIRNSNLRSFNPHVNEVYTFAEDVTFTSTDGGPGTPGDPAERSFTIPAGATITLN
jgi:hypothetical protein